MRQRRILGEGWRWGFGAVLCGLAVMIFGATRVGGPTRTRLPQKEVGAWPTLIAIPSRATGGVGALDIGGDDRSPMEAPPPPLDDARKRLLSAYGLTGEPQELLLSDPDPHVRQRALFVIRATEGQAAVPELKRVALDPEEDPMVRAAAMANLDFLKRHSGSPPRGDLHIDPVPRIVVGVPFELRLRFESEMDVPSARLSLTLPRGMEALSPDALRWEGTLRAHQVQEITVNLLVRQGPIQSQVLAFLDLDFREVLDIDTLREMAPVVCDEEGGEVLASIRMPRR